MRILAFPKAGISYNDCFYRAVEALGVPVLEGEFAGRWLWSQVRPGDWLHFHWPSFSYANPGSLPAKAKAFVRFVSLLLIARVRGARIAWTAHNLMPHDRDRVPALDVLGRHVIIALSTLIFVHGPEARRVLVERFPGTRRKSSTIPHGHWIGYYRNDVTRRSARERLGIAESSYVYLFFGLCKPYKNLDGVVRAFRGIDGDAVLVIAGRFQNPAYQAAIEQLAAGDARVRLHPRFIADDEVQVYLRACDAVVVPYREILTSGTAMLGLTFGRPVISVGLGNLRDLITPECGVLFDADAADGLAAAMRDASGRRFAEDAILARARHFTFEDAARTVVDAMAKGAPVTRGPDAPSAGPAGSGDEVAQLEPRAERQPARGPAPEHPRVER